MCGGVLFALPVTLPPPPPSPFKAPSFTGTFMEAETENLVQYVFAHIMHRVKGHHRWFGMPDSLPLPTFPNPILDDPDQTSVEPTLG